MATFTVITEPTAEPVTLLEAKSKLRILHDDEDDLVLGLIKSAREFTKDFCNIYLMPTVIELTMDKWPALEFGLGTSPLISIDSVKYFDTSSPSVETTLTVNTDYYSDTVIEGGRIISIGGWPSVAVRPNAITITMTAGHVSAEKVPQRLKDGILTQIVSLYELDPELDKSAKSILWRNRIL